MCVPALLSLALAAAGCGGDDDSPSDGGPDSGGGPAAHIDSGTGHSMTDAGKDDSVDKPVDDAGMSMMDKPHGDVIGHVYRADKLTPVANATITGPNGIKVKTDKNGKFKFAMLETARTALLANAKNYAQAIEPVRIAADTTTSVEFRLIRISAKADIDASQGGQVRAASGAEVVLDKGAFIGPDGKPVTGVVTVELTVLDPSTPEGMQAFPGDFAATSNDGDDGQLESFVPMEITVRQGDTVLDFADGKGAEVSFPVPESLKDKAPATIALWSLSEETGAWVEEGIATLITDGAGNLVYRGRLTHMSWWNCDRFIDRVTCIRGCITSDGKPAPGVLTQAEGIDYSNIGMDTTDDEGCFAEDVKAGAQLRVRGLTENATTEWKTIDAPDDRMSMYDDRSKCHDVGTLELVERKDADMGCPAGTSKCGDNCVDLATDYDNCGACAKSCFGGSLSGELCIDSKCACAASQTRCDSSDGPDVCTDLNFDERNCGACGTKCGDGKMCNAGKCKAIDCADGLTLCGSSCVDVDENSLHCGECNNSCEYGDTCKSGDCKGLTCPDTQEECGNECVAEGTCPKAMLPDTGGGNAGNGGNGGNGGTGATSGGGGSTSTGSGGFGNPDPDVEDEDGGVTTTRDGGLGGGGFGGGPVDDKDGGFDGCSADQVMCPTGECIFRSQICDNSPDCSDGIDEMVCNGLDGGIIGGPDGGTTSSDGGKDCGAGQIKCPTGECIFHSQICDDTPDCSDGVDEMVCSDGGIIGGPDGGAVDRDGGDSCGGGRIKCPTGECIFYSQICDDAEDCGDGIDEMNCDGGSDGGVNGGPDGGSDPICPPGWFSCPDLGCSPTPIDCPEPACPPEMFDCGNGNCAPSPEFCGPPGCPQGMYKCGDGQCVPSPDMCDGGGGPDCGADQMPCQNANGDPICGTMCDMNTECSNGMDENPFLCCDRQGGVMCEFDAEHNMDCITENHVCANDGMQCFAGEDEDPARCCEQNGGISCEDAQNNPICVPMAEVCNGGEPQCSNGRDEEPGKCCSEQDGFFCRGSGECLEYQDACDLVSECADGSDESIETCGCGPELYQCSDNSQCIPALAFCDDMPDCGDGSDEDIESCGCPDGMIVCPGDEACAPDPQSCPGK